MKRLRQRWAMRHVPYPVETLYMLIVVELQADPGGPRADYMIGRRASYRFVLDAMERRWPALQERRRLAAKLLPDGDHHG